MKKKFLCDADGRAALIQKFHRCVRWERETEEPMPLLMTGV